MPRDPDPIGARPPVVREALVAGLLAGYGIAVPVGAIAALIVSLTARTSLRIGAAAGLGAATADGLYAALAVLAGAAAVKLLAPVAEPMRWLAAVVLLALAVRTAYTAWRQHRDGATPRPAGGLHTVPRAYLGVLTLTVLNPSTIVYFAALVLGRHATAGRDTTADAVFVLAVFAASASWQLLLAGGGSVLGRILTGPRGRLATSAVSSIVIAALAVALVLPAARPMP